MAAVNKIRKIALGGVLAAFTVLSLYISAILPANKFFFFGLSSVFIAVVLVETGVKNGWVFYAATTLLALLVLPDKLHVIPYALFFGIYGIVKYYAEKVKKFVVEFIIKLFYFNLTIIPSFLLAGRATGLPASERFPWWILLAAANAAFLVYDYAFTVFIRFYFKRLKTKN